MKLALAPDAVAFRDELREFYRTKIPAEIRDKVKYGRELSRDDIVTAHKTLHANGLAVPNWPAEWGGKDWTPLQRHIWEDEMQLACVPEPLTFNANMIGPVIAQFGSTELKQRFLPPTASLDIWWCQGFSEPDAGSDLASLRTTAVRDGDSYIVNGQKIWTTLAQYADWIFCLVRTNPDAPKKQAGISMLLFDVNTPGVTIRPIKLIDGHHEVNEVFFENVRVPAENLVGPLNGGWGVANGSLGHERTLLWLSFADRLQELLEDFRPKTALHRDRYATLAMDNQALRLLGSAALAREARGEQDVASLSVLKLLGSEAVQSAADSALYAKGIDGLDHPAMTAPFNPLNNDNMVSSWFERYVRSFAGTIAGGTSEIQRNIVAERVLGLPR